MAPKRAVELRILENENEKPRSVRVPCNGDANLESFRAFLEGFKEKPVVPWPFDFWDSELNTRIDTRHEQMVTLEMDAYVVTIIRSHSGQSMAEKESMGITEPTTMEISTDAGSSNRTSGQKEACPSSSSCEEEEPSCPKLEAKHKVFLSHSGEEKPFVEQLCKDLEGLSHFPFFDQRDDSLPKGEKFATLIFDAAKQCKVAVVVLSRGFLRSRWPMLELVSFVRAKRSTNKSLTVLPLFYKVSVDALSEESIRKEWKPRWLQLVQAERGDDVEEWAGAVRELRSINGPNFELFGKSEVKYREDIVRQVFKCSPPDMLYDTSQISGSDRICKSLEGRFLPHGRTCSQVLGLHGMGGLGKTTMSKLLCNHFNQEFSGRVCHIEMKEEIGPLERQQMVMRKLLGCTEELLQNQFDVSQGWDVLRNRMSQHPVFLVVDNVHDEVSREEARNYLSIEYNAMSKIVVTSRGSDVVEDLLGKSCYCHHVPFLEREEAAEVLLRQVDSSMNYTLLTREEKASVMSCLEEACSSGEVGDYHPMALIALGVHFRDRKKTCKVLTWNLMLQEYRELKGTGESNIRIYKTLGLGFSSMDGMTQLMFIDVCLFARKALELPLLSNSPLEDLIGWLANIHGVSTAVAEFKIYEFKRSGMTDVIKVEREYSERLFEPNAFQAVVHDLYVEYAVWFLEHIREEVRSVWCVGENGDLRSSLPRHLQGALGICRPELERVRLENMRCDGYLQQRLRDWCNVVVLQIVECSDLTTISLQGLTCLRHLELKDLENLRILTFTGDGSSSSNSRSEGTHTELEQHRIPSLLQFVIIRGLDSLERLPCFSPGTSLRFLHVMDCGGLTQPPSVQGCVGLEGIRLSWIPEQKTLPNLDGLTSLRELTIYSDDMFDTFKGEALKINGLSSLISLLALDLLAIPVGDLAGLENLPHVQVIELVKMHHLTSFPSLDNVETSALHSLQVTGVRDARLGKKLEKLMSSVSAKVVDLARNGQRVPVFPWKRREPVRAGAFMRVSKFLRENSKLSFLGV